MIYLSLSPLFEKYTAEGSCDTILPAVKRSSLLQDVVEDVACGGRIACDGEIRVRGNSAQCNNQSVDDLLYWSVRCWCSHCGELHLSGLFLSAETPPWSRGKPSFPRS